MNNRIVVSDDKFDQDSLDLLIAVCGYESRCIEVAKELHSIAAKKLAFKYSSRKLFNFDRNIDWYLTSKFDVIDFEKDGTFCKTIIDSVESVESEEVNIVVDYSSMCRFLIASIVSTINNLSEHKTLNVKFVYTPAEYYDPKDIQTEISISEPVLPQFSGKLMPPNMPTVAFLGLGYEAERALGLMEYLEPGEIRAYLPTGCDEQFDNKVEELNVDFFNFIGKDDLQQYEVHQPYTLFKNLESVCYGVLQWGRPVFVPLGPKPFTICSLIISCLFDFDPVVWRVSGGQQSDAVDRVRAGDFVWLSVTFNKYSITEQNSV